MARSRRTPYTILGCLSLRPMSGYDIKKFIDGSISHFWSESYGQIYPTLKAMEVDGLVKSRVEDRDGLPDRRVYRLTDAGLTRLREWLVEPAVPHVPRYEMSLKLFFGAQMPLDAAVEHLERYRSRQAALLEEYDAQAARMEAELSGDPRLPYWRLVLKGGIDYAKMAIGWCDDALAELRDLDPSPYPAAPAAERSPDAEEST